MTRRMKLLMAGALVAAVPVVAAATGDTDTPITGAALEQASAAALAHTGGGTVTDSEVGDEESLYEVEVTLDDGRQIDVQLDESFIVVGEETDNDG